MEQTTLELEKAMDLFIGNCELQAKGVDVAIPFLVGKPGGGKTASINTAIRKAGWGMMSVHIGMKPLEEFGGIPDFIDVTINGERVRGTRWSFPDIMGTLYREAERVAPNPFVVLFDDIHFAGPNHMALLHELFTERRLREYPVPENTAFGCAGNPSNKAGARTITSGVVNRCFMVNVHTSVNSWKKNFAFQNGVRSDILSFLSNDSYSHYFHGEELVNEPWPSPRAWTRLSTIIDHLERRGGLNAGGLEDEIVLHLASGHVGKEAGVKFTAHYSIYNQFDIPKILKNASKFKLPNEESQIFALAYGLVHYYYGNNKSYRDIDKDMAHIVIAFVDNNRTEIARMVISELVMLDKINNTKVADKLIKGIQKVDIKYISTILQMIAMGE